MGNKYTTICYTIPNQHIYNECRNVLQALFCKEIRFNYIKIVRSHTGNLLQVFCGHKIRLVISELLISMKECWVTFSQFTSVPRWPLEACDWDLLEMLPIRLFFHFLWLNAGQQGFGKSS